jgi:hypothetical protein
MLLRGPFCEEAILHLFRRFDLEAKEMFSPPTWYAVNFCLRANIG